MTFQGINQVNFGHIAAEEEASYLEKYFIETEEYAKVREDAQKILVTGRKGSGKSAIYVALRDHLPKKEKHIVVEALTLHNYPWQIHKRVRDEGVPDEQAYINSWKYIVWILLSKKILHFQQVRPYKLIDILFWKKLISENTRYIYRFLKQNYGSISPSFIEIIADRTRDIRSIKALNTEISSNSDINAFDRLSRAINVVNNEIQPRVLHLLSKKQRYYVLFDQLDLGWDNTDETKQLMIGLVLAARDIVRAAQRAGKDVHVVIFLRSDIYETLRFEDKNKLSPDVVELRWNEDRLKDLVSKRISASAEGAWEDLFTGDIMRQQLSQLSYIVRRTMLRPRDIIQYCVFAKESAIRRSKNQIDKESIYEGERPYSDYMRREIQDESNALPVSIDLLFGLLQDIRSNRVQSSQFLDYCASRGIENPHAALQQLIDLSVFGVYKIGGSNRGSSIVYKYQALPWETLEPSPVLAVHPSLKHALSLIEGRSSNNNTVTSSIPIGDEDNDTEVDI